MKNLIFSCLLVFVSATTFAQYDPDAKAVLDAMSNKYKAIPAFTASFVQELKNEQAGLDESISGTVHVKDDQYKLEISGQIIYNDGNDIWSYSPDTKEVTVSTFEPDEESITLGNIWELYQEGFKYILLAANDNGNQVIDLDPEDRNSRSYFKIRMIINQSYELQSFTVYEDSGNQFTYRVTEFKERADLQDTDFRFDPAQYPGVEVVDFRN